ncbi:adenylate/guanylate cyclase domain-containing protein [Floridanema aerugineum]|uniref:Adenylate/guanylate cyclase domain-containing protein n=1 Tax=Floridaenema aerugineum BLCC-F46 TaxID=3153654 RepID=A0ABV4X497_9CYAN
MLNHPPRILLVDDEPVNITLLESLLQSEGYDTLSAASGMEALTIAKTSIPDLIVLDIMMPGMNGFEVCQKLREDSIVKTIPIIFLTALDGDNFKLRGLEVMGDDFLTKPFKNDLLLSKIASILRLQEMRSQQVQQQLKEKTKRQLSAAWNINLALSEKLRLFVPDQFLRRIAPTGVESIQLGNSQEEEITVLFCDIRKFTAICESQSASETFQWLNVFFSQMNDCIIANHGFIDKYLGDALMVVFDRPETHPQDAVNGALMMQQKIVEFNSDRSKYNLEQPINIGIGIHTGKGIIGALGADSRLDSTVIGDVVNTASRLQELTKHYECGIIASDSVISQLTLSEVFEVRWIDRVVPRGKQQAQDIYEICRKSIPPTNQPLMLT